MAVNAQRAHAGLRRKYRGSTALLATATGAVGAIAGLVFAMVTTSDNLRSSLLPALTVLVPAMLGLFGLMIQREQAAHASADTWRRGQMAEAYASAPRLLGLMTNDGEAAMAEIVRFMRDDAPSLTLYGSDEVVRTLNRFREIGNLVVPDGEVGPSGRAMLVAWSDVLVALRHDSGHRRTELVATDMARVFLTDSTADLKREFAAGRRELDAALAPN